VLVGVFFVATALTVSAVYGLALILVNGFALYSPSTWDSGGPSWQWWCPRVAGWVCGPLALMILAATWYTIRKLGDDGGSVAEWLGGTWVPPDAQGLVERRLLNIVEEMALAAGVAIPRVYLLVGEQGINAFAAGLSQEGAAVAVTQGAVEKLSRDELQGVVAHEFSHILNSDIRLNLRLLGVLAGILLLSDLGRWMIRIGSVGRSGEPRGNGFVILLGVALFLVGSVGFFVGRVIKAGVSRQREYLADAAAVQFTRNPHGIGLALAKIANHSFGSWINRRHAEDASHLFFADGIGGWLGSMLSTHPPLSERVRRVLPGQKVKLPPAADWGLPQDPACSGVVSKLFDGLAAATNESTIAVTALQARDEIGRLQPGGAAVGQAVLAALGEDLHARAATPVGAMAIVYGLLSRDNITSGKEALHRAAAQHLDAETTIELKAVFPQIAQLDRSLWLPLTELALATLRQLSKEELPSFLRGIQTFCELDCDVSVFEIVLQRLVRHRLMRGGGRRSSRPSFVSLVPLRQDVEIVMTALAMAGHGNNEAVLAAYSAGLSAINSWDASPSSSILQRPRFQALDGAMERIGRSVWSVRERIVNGCIECVFHDGKVTVEEAELLRALLEAVDCPIPPFFAAPHPIRQQVEKAATN